MSRFRCYLWEQLMIARYNAMANFSLAVTPHTHSHSLSLTHLQILAATCRAHKLRIRRIGQHASLNSRYIFIFFSRFTFLLSGPNSWAYSLGHSSFFMALTLSLVSDKQTQHKQQQQQQQQQQQRPTAQLTSLFFTNTPLWPNILYF